MSVPICPHRDVTPSRLVTSYNAVGRIVGRTQMVRCEACGREFARIRAGEGPPLIPAKAMASRERSLTDRALRYRKAGGNKWKQRKEERAARLRIENARERLFNPQA